MYYLFLDESGDHNYKSIDNAPIFVLAGCIFNNKSNYLSYLESVNKFHKFKEKHFNNFYTILHTRDITRSVKAFKNMRNSKYRASFAQDSNSLINNCDFLLISAIIYKQSLFDKFGQRATDPYLYSFDRIIERFVFFLDDAHDEKKGMIFYESRANRLDRQLEKRYLSIKKYGTIKLNNTINLDKDRINNRIIDIIKINKDSNIAGIQISDLCATPIARNELGKSNNFIKYNIIKNKFRKGPAGKIKGYGKIVIK